MAVDYTNMSGASQPGSSEYLDSGGIARHAEFEQKMADLNRDGASKAKKQKLVKQYRDVLTGGEARFHNDKIANESDKWDGSLE